MSNDSKRRAEEWARHHMTYRGIDPLGYNAERPKLVAHFATAMAQEYARGRREGLEEAAERVEAAEARVVEVIGQSSKESIRLRNALIVIEAALLDGVAARALYLTKDALATDEQGTKGDGDG